MRCRSVRPARALVLAVGAAVLAGGPLPADTTVTTHPYRGVTKIDTVRTSPRNQTVHVLVIDLTAPGIRFEVSPAAPPEPAGTLDGVAVETRVERTLDFMNRVGAQFAVNAAFFGHPAAGDGGTYITGFCCSRGHVSSGFEARPVLAYAIVPDAPGIDIDATNNARVVCRGSSPLAIAAAPGGDDIRPHNTVTGCARIVTDGTVTIPTYATEGGVLVPDARHSARRSWYDRVDARTGIGLSRDAKTLCLFTIDAAGGSAGMTVGEMAEELRTGHGAWNALNLDGGGSTTMTWVDPATGRGRTLTVPSDGGVDRAVAASLAVFAEPAPRPGEPGRR